MSSVVVGPCGTWWVSGPDPPADLRLGPQERDRALTSTVIRTHSTGTVKGQHPGTVVYTE